MLDTFTILTTSGVVLWSRSYTAISPSVINNFISDVFIEEKATAFGLKDAYSAQLNPPYRSEQHTLKWALVKELGVIFVVGFYPPFPSVLLNDKGYLAYSDQIGRISITPSPLVGRPVCG